MTKKYAETPESKAAKQTFRKLCRVPLSSMTEAQMLSATLAQHVIIRDEGAKEFLRFAKSIKAHAD